MKKKLLILLTAVLAVTAGCKKDPDEKPNGVLKYLTKVTETSGDESTIYLLTYDGSDRLTAYKTEDGDVGQFFTYDATGKLTKIEDKSGNDNNVYEFIYNSGGAPVSGFHKRYNGTSLISTDEVTYTLNNGKVSEIKYTDEEEEETIYKFSYQGDNLTKMEVMLGEDPAYVALTYGTKKSPFYALASKYVLIPGISLELASKNDVLSATSYLNDAVISKVNNTYTYDSDGYPLTSESITEGSFGGTTRTVFQYR